MTRRRLATLAAATVAAGLLVVAPSLAIRLPTHTEAEAIQRDLGLQRCDWRAGISTVDPVWARIEVDPARCAAVASLNTLAHLDRGRWTGSAWTADLQALCPADAPIPEMVAGDLRLCVGPLPAAVSIACDKAGGRAAAHRIAPRRCPIRHRSHAYGDVIDLRALQWRGWGRAVARARGTEGDRPVAVRAWRIRRCHRAGGVRAYTRLRIASVRGVLAARRSACS